MAPKVTKIALSGGPGGGKSSLKKELVPWLNSLGFYVIFVPEAATQIMQSGPHWSHPDDVGGSFQQAILRHIMSNEDLLEEAARRLCGDKNIVMLCDRGAPEIEAYMGREQATEVLGRMGLTRGELLARYHTVIFMVTAADGAPKAFEAAKANNPDRSESVEQAVARDKLTQRCWLGAESLSIIQNSGDGKEAWRRKVEQAKRAVGRKLGIPEPVEIERKYALTSFSLDGIPSEEAEIEQIYLKRTSLEVERRIRRRVFAGHTLYFYTEKEQRSEGVRIENERRISWAEYERLKQDADPALMTLRKYRRYFLYEGQYFELDTFSGFSRMLTLLEIELPTLDTPVKLPPGFKAHDVTGDKRYGNYNIAHGFLCAS